MKISKLWRISDKELGESRLGRFLYPDGRCTRRGLVATLLSVLLALSSVGVLIYYIFGPMEGHLHSDYTDTIYWANATIESGKVFDPDFVYAGLLPFSANLWMMPLILMFGVSMTAQNIGMLIFMLLLVAALYFMCRSFKWSISWTAITITIFTLLLSGSDKLREIMWGHVIYYSLALLLLCVGIGVAVRVSEIKAKPRVREIVLCVLGGLLFAGTATNGFQLVALVTLPCIGVIVAEMLLDPTKKLLDKTNTASIIGVIGIGVCTVIGVFLLNLMKGDIKAGYTTGYSYIAPVDTWVGNLLEIPKSWFQLFGVNYERSMEMMKPESLMMIFMAVVGVVIALLPIVGLFNYRKITDRGVRAILIAHLAVSAVIMFGYTCGYLGGAIWRMTPMMGTAVLGSAATVKHFMATSKEITFVPRRLAALLMAMLIGCSCLNFNAMATMPADFGRDNSKHRLVQELEARGLEYGYASFWYSQAITLLSDSKIKARMILADAEDGVTTDYYQNSFKWYEDQPGVDRYFVILSMYENSVVSKSVEWLEFVNQHAVEKDYLFDSFVLYVFDCNLEFPDPEIYR